ncbi:MAG: ATP-binding cassette domain-containing protein [Verrucomicrobiota bacterium]
MAELDLTSRDPQTERGSRARVSNLPDSEFGPGRRRWWRRRLIPGARRTEAPEIEQTMLPMLIEVFAGFTKLDGQLIEAEVDSILGFLRYDYPEAVYTELRRLFITSLNRRQDLNQIALDLAEQLTLQEKVLLGVQLYVLISRAGLPKENLITFYQFMTSLGVASEAINIVYQLNTNELDSRTAAKTEAGGSDSNTGSHQLESLVFSNCENSDVLIGGGEATLTVAAFRFHDLLLIKNVGPDPILARGRQVNAGEFYRVYEGQQLIIGEEVLGFDDLVFYFNSKRNVSAVQLYLARDGNGRHTIEKARSKQSFLKVSFGLKIEVEVIGKTNASISGRTLSIGDQFEVTAREKIIFSNETELHFDDLRRKAREFGGRFTLPPNRTNYLVSNDPTNLSEGDILLTPGTIGKVLLRIRCNYAAKTGHLAVIEAERTIAVDGEPVRAGEAELVDDSVIYLGDGQYLRCHFSEGIIEEERNVINSLKVHDIGHSYDRRTTALDTISFSIQRGEMVCVMGPSGCGKSTLLKALGGQLKPRDGRIELNGLELYRNHDDLKSYIALIPQDETFDPLLSVEENLDTAAAIRAPHFPIEERRRRVDSKLIELGLNEIRHRLAGDHITKSLSGGQRRRLNAGMDMIGIADVYLFDEPTSGLSSKDSEHVLEIIRGLTHNKITLVSIHQPSNRLFHLFDKAILLDNGGKLAFAGTPQQMLDYFREACESEGVHQSVVPGVDSENGVVGLTPDFVFDVLETPLRDLSGDIIYERDARNNYIPARRFNSTFWSDRFQTYRLLEEVSIREIEAETSQTISLQKAPEAPKRTLRQDWVRFANQLKRAFLSKLRNRSNLVTTLLEAPALSLLIALVMRYTEEGLYNFENAFHIPTYLFLTHVTALFLGMTNSAEEVIRDRNLLERERHHGFRVTGYIVSKYLSLGFFALIQCVIYLLIGDSILGIRAMFWQNLLWMGGTAIVGIAAGLVISALVNSPKTAINIIPMILIPNIILGGALIKYDEMNRSLDIVENIRNWFSAAEKDAEASQLKVPFICHLMPLRWSYEAVIISHAEHNPASRLTNRVESEIQSFAEIPITQELTEDQSDYLNQLKYSLAVIHGLTGDSPKSVNRQLRHIEKSLRARTFDPDPIATLSRELREREDEQGIALVLERLETVPDLPIDEAARLAEEVRESIETGKPVEIPTEEPAEAQEVEPQSYTAGQLYLNEKVQDLYNRAEVERVDYRRQSRPPNVFFGKERHFQFPIRSEEPWFAFSIETLRLNILALLAFILVGALLLRVCLARQLRKV